MYYGGVEAARRNWKWPLSSKTIQQISKANIQASSDRTAKPFKKTSWANLAPLAVSIQSDATKPSFDFKRSTIVGLPLICRAEKGT